MKKILLAAMLTTCWLVVSGCGPGIVTYPVTGTVSQAGKPIEGAAVTFQPASGDGAAAVGVTDASGSYRLMTKTNVGAIPGAYKVSIAKYEGGAADAEENSQPATDPYDITNEYPENYDELSESNQAAKEISLNTLPKRYADPNSSGLSAQVAEGENRFDFDLEKK